MQPVLQPHHEIKNDGPSDSQLQVVPFQPLLLLYLCLRILLSRKDRREDNCYCCCLFYGK